MYRSVKWTALATPGMIAVESFAGLFILRRPMALRAMFKVLGIALSLYTLWFYIHFAMLPLSGDGDAFMPMDFQKTLINGTRYDVSALMSYVLVPWGT